MKSRTIIFQITVLFIFVCCKETPKEYPVQFAPKIVVATGHTLSSDSIQKPKAERAGAPKMYQAKKPDIVNLRKNKYLAGVPKSLKPVESHISDDSALSVKRNKAVITSVKAGHTTTSKAKDAITRDRNPYSFSSFGKLQGLNHNIINCIIQDQTGLLWLGSDGGGVSTFDGSTFKYFTENSGLINNYVYCILEDNKGNMWFGTRGGVSRYDGKYFTDFSASEGFTDSRIQSMIQKSNGDIWFGTYGSGITVYDGESFIQSSFTDNMNLNNILCMAQDKAGNVWLGTDGGGIIKHDGNSYIHYSLGADPENNVIRCIFEDESNNIWFGTNNSGIIKSDGKNFVQFSVNEGLRSNTINDICQDKENNIWFANSEGGLTMFDGRFLTHFSEEEGLINNSIISLLIDRNDNLWFSAYGGGISKYAGNIFTHLTTREGLSNDNIYGLASDREGNIWMGPFGGGLIKFNGDTFSIYPPEKGLNDNTVLCILEDKDGNIWAGTSGSGVSRFDGRNFSVFTEKEGLSSNYVFCMMQDREGNMWFGTYGGGVTKYDGKTFTSFSQKEGLSNNIILSIFQDNTGAIWFGTSGGGVTKYFEDSYTQFASDDGLGNGNIYCIIQDGTGNIWFGTNEGGVTRYNGETFTRYTEKEGLSNNAILAMLNDRNGNIWFGTRDGLNKLSFDKLKELNSVEPSGDFTSAREDAGLVFFKTYSYEDGFLGIGCSRGSICEDKNGVIWIGANDKLTAYHPEGDLADTMDPGIQLTGIELFDEEIPWSDLENKKDTVIRLVNGVKIENFRFDSILSWFGLPENLSLSFRNNFLTINFRSITQKQNAKVRYQYILEGLNENWSALSVRTSASFGNLAPGDYNFKVKCLNSYGHWSDEATYKFTIRPPWWKTLWFKAIAAFCIIFALFAFYRWRIATLRKQKKLLEKLVEEKTMEVLNQNEELHSQREELEVTLDSLKEAQKQLILSEKMASLGVLASGIAHEINNPLNFIQGGIEVLDDYFRENLKEHVSEVKPLISGIKEGVKRAAVIVTSLNHFSRQDDQPRVQCNIHQIIDNCLMILQNELKDRIEIEKNYTREPHRLSCNEGKLHQAILNILANASQSIERMGYIRITTTFKNEKLIIEISDNGKGISKENLPKIIDPFFTTKDPGKGTGLGLSITYSIIKEHDGDLEFISEPEKGTTAIIWLPTGK